MIVSTLQPVLLEANRSGLEWLLHGHVRVPFWPVALLVGLAITVGLVYLVRRLE